ncbi:MAG: sulfite exporter TauE/SafE family protein [Pseudomonadota bacterium]|nr:sulfite exporter TauE/SafE family protein [Pseudomonadota bacterium]
MSVSFIPGFDPPLLIFLFLTVLAAYTAFGATGFGSSVIAVPMLAHWFPLTFAVPFVASLDLVATIMASYRQWRFARLDELRRIAPALLLGILAGTTLLVRLARAPALLALGIFVTSYGLMMATRRLENVRVPAGWSWPLGFAGGVFSALFGTGGPLYMIYLAGRITDRRELRATSSVLIAVSVAVRIAAFATSGLLLQPGLPTLALIMLPVLLAGYALGSRVHHALSQRSLMRALCALLIANGVILIVRSLALMDGR